MGVFVCFCTKAIHLELVSDLTSEACLAAVRRFFGRRGRLKNIYSDNRTNFVGARKEIIAIRELWVSEARKNKLMYDITDEGVDWHFSPPRSPHFEGLWETAVQ